MSSEAVSSDAAVVAATARYFKVLGDPTRLAVLELLVEGPCSVSDLVAALGVSQARISNHLACLRWCEFVEFEKVGRQVIYRLRDERVVELISLARTLSASHCDLLASCTRIGPEWL